MMRNTSNIRGLNRTAKILKMGQGTFNIVLE